MTPLLTSPVTDPRVPWHARAHRTGALSMPRTRTPVPETVTEREEETTRGWRRRTETLALVEEMLAVGALPRDICEALDRTPGSLTYACRVTDRNDLARPFERLDRIARRAKKRGQR